MTTKTKFIFLMSFLALVIVGCVASMVIVLAAPKQKGVLDVSIKYVGGLHKEREMFNGRYYYYYEMGEYPQTYAGAFASATVTLSNEKFVCDLSTPTSIGVTTITEDKEYDVYVDTLGFRYIKHTVNPYGTGAQYAYVNGTEAVKNEEALFKIEPIKWDIVGYYNNDKTDFTRASDDDFDPTVSTNLVVTSRTALQGLPWSPNSYTTDVNYNQSFIYTWLRTFETNVLAQYKDRNIVKVTNNYNDTNETSWSEIQNGTATIAGNASEYAWIMDYTQASTLFASNAERRSAPSDFAIATYAYQSSSGTSHDNITKQASCISWLRSSFFIGSGSYYDAGYVDRDGSFNYTTVNYTTRAVRPTLLINL